MRYSILIAEDDPDIIDMLSLYLDAHVYSIVRAGDGEIALELFRKTRIDLVLVDLMMPKMNGYELIKTIREESNIPIIIMSARNFDTDKVMGLNIGADAYLTKPFNPFELTAYIQALLRRYYELGAGEGQKAGNKILQLGDLELDHETFTVRKNGEPILLTSTEFKILSKFMHNPGRVFTKAQLLECISNDLYSETDENTITVHISNLRSKLGSTEENNVSIKTIRGLGYKIETNQ